MQTGQIVNGYDYDEVGWKALKRAYAVGDFTTICCGKPAVPKKQLLVFRIAASRVHRDASGQDVELLAVYGNAPDQFDSMPVATVQQSCESSFSNSASAA